ncbi:MAG: hypothetical protein MK066_04080 [Crocinitomicaceae bacterium]|nr:hypothetical protein [Crocinitomicaceae bacterium]
MKKVHRKYQLTLVFLVLGILTGSIFYFRQTPLDIWRVNYAYRSDQIDQLPDFAVKSTLFLHQDVLIRHCLSSYSDTSRAQGISRNEMKFSVNHPSNKENIRKTAVNLFSSEAIDIEEIRFWETQRSKRPLFGCILLGIFIGLVFDFIISFRKQPNT